ncbi:MAG: hypothetical protein WC428_02565 [Candidatus Paceibacterota bacterium]|jgi:hypothetical protein
MSSVNGGNSKREILVDARKELFLAKKFLKGKEDVDSQYAKMHIDMATKLVNGVITGLEAPVQTYHLD